MLLNPYLATTGVGTGGGGPTYFFEERFEPTGYTNTWTEAGTGTIEEDYTTSPLEGSQSLKITAAGQQPTTTSTFASDQDELWGYFKFRVDSSPIAAARVFNLRNTTPAVVFIITLQTDNGLTCTNGGIASSATATKMTTSTDYHIWWHWTKGTGTDGVGSVGFSTTGTEATSGGTFTSTGAGTSVTDAHDVQIGHAGTNRTVQYVIDQILMSTTATIGDSPA